MDKTLIEILESFPCFERTEKGEKFKGYNIIYSHEGKINTLKIEHFGILNNKIIKDKIIEVLQ